MMNTTGATKLTAILAVADDGTIGKDGALPWRIPEDLQRFKALTSSHAIIMGRRTFDSIGKALPFRRNIVASEAGARCIGCEVYRTPVDALRAAYETDAEPFLIGGARLYARLWPLVTRVELTEVHRSFDPTGAVTFAFDRNAFQEVQRDRARDNADVEFVTLERRP